MTRYLSKLVADSKARYLFIGASSFLVELLVIFIAQQAGASGTLAVAISFVVGLGVSFILQKIITFRDRRFQKKTVARQIYMYAALVVFNFGFTILAVAVFEPYFPAALIRTVALAITVLWNYYLYKTWIFKRETP